MSKGNEVVRVHVGPEATRFGNSLWNSLDYSLRYGLYQEVGDRDMWGQLRPGMKNINWNDDLIHLSKYYECSGKEGSHKTVEDNYIRAVILDSVWDTSLEELPTSSENKAENPTVIAGAYDITMNNRNESQPALNKRLNDIKYRLKSWNNTFTNVVASIEDNISSAYMPSMQTQDDIEDSVRHQLQTCDLVERFHIDIQLSSPTWCILNQNVVTPYLQEETPKALKILLGLRTAPMTGTSSPTTSLNMATLKIRSDIFTSLLLSKSDHKDNETLRIVPTDQNSSTPLVPTSLMDNILRNVNDENERLCLKKELLAAAERGLYRAAYQNKGYRNYVNKLSPSGSVLTDLTFALLPTDIDSIPFGGKLASEAIRSWMDIRCQTGESKDSAALLWSYGDVPQTMQTSENVFFTGLSDMNAQTCAMKWKPKISTYELSSCMMNSYSNPLPMAHADALQKRIPSDINPLGQLEVGDTSYGSRPSHTSVDILSTMNCHRAVVPGSRAEGGNAHNYNVIQELLTSLDLVTKTSKYKSLLDNIGVEWDEVIGAQFELKEYNTKDVE